MYKDTKRRIRSLLIFGALLLSLTGCENKAVESGSECVIELMEVPKEMEMLSENIKESFRVDVELENVYTEKSVSVELSMEENFKTTLKLQPGTYRVKDCSVSHYSLLPMDVKEAVETVEVFQDKKANLQVRVENPEDVADWIWNQQVQREIMETSAFSHKVQFCGEVIDLKNILNYIEVVYDRPITAYSKEELVGNHGVTITVLNETAEAADWRNCTLKKVAFRQSNVVWGQGAYPGMAVKDAVHAQDGLYGKPTKIEGTVLVGTGYDHTKVVWLDEKSGDKLTLWIHPDGDYIYSIVYEFAVFE